MTTTLKMEAQGVTFNERLRDCEPNQPEQHAHLDPTGDSVGYEGILFDSVDMLMKPFLSAVSKQYIALLEQLFSSYRGIISECLSINFELREKNEELKKRNAELIYESNIRHLHAAFNVNIHRECAIEPHRNHKEEEHSIPRVMSRDEKDEIAKSPLLSLI